MKKAATRRHDSKALTKTSGALRRKLLRALPKVPFERDREQLIQQLVDQLPSLPRRATKEK